MTFRKLRIAWSVWWGLACVLLIVLWVRSYSHYDDLMIHACGRSGGGCSSLEGRLTVGVFGDREFAGQWKHASGSVGAPTAGWTASLIEHENHLGCGIAH